jgi:hypothetical protein
VRGGRGGGEEAGGVGEVIEMVELGFYTPLLAWVSRMEAGEGRD